MPGYNNRHDVRLLAILHAEESSYLTTFNTPYGKFRFTRMPFGLHVAGDAFQYKLDVVYSNLKGVTGIA